MDYKLPDGLIEMAKGLIASFEIAYQEVEPQVEFIISHNIRDIDFIEHKLDEIMDIQTDKGYRLFVRLCEYVRTFDEEVANEYMEIYDELYGDEESTQKKNNSL